MIQNELRTRAGLTSCFKAERIASQNAGIDPRLKAPFGTRLRGFLRWIPRQTLLVYRDKLCNTCWANQRSGQIPSFSLRRRIFVSVSCM